MYKKIGKATAAIILAAAPLTISLAPAQAVLAGNSSFAQETRINGEGFRACRALGDSGYKATVRGLASDGGGGDRSAGFRVFRVNTCFKTQAKCQNFLDRIHHKIPAIYQINYIKCRSRG